MSRGEIGAIVGLSRSTLSEITGHLLQRGAIVVVDTDAGRREGSGRPAERLALDPGSGQFMGIDFGHRRVHVVVADASHEILISGSTPYHDDTPWAERISHAFAMIDRLSAEAKVHFGALQGIGIGVPGPFPRPPAASPRPTTGPAGRGWADGLNAAFTDRFAAPVLIDNNTRLAGLAEAISGGNGGGNGVDDLVYVRLSDGVGGGLVVGSRLVTGSAGLAGEFGHVTVEPDGTECRCGKFGCLETVASVPAILRRCQELGVPLADLTELESAVRRSHPVVDQVLRAAAAAVGRVVGVTAMSLNPAKIVIGGEITRIAPVIVQQVAATVAYELFPSSAPGPAVLAAQLSHEAGAVGALAALFHSSPLLVGYPEADAWPTPRHLTPEGVAHGRSH
ncbi:ROK family transcriptional regulator [Kribbella sancticallisti]|uniref:ROK family transcriptional regulator n=2 Tax=Kribbella sancticallisti TaxID=460087 RepID=A0ABP4NEE0_9ACTN